MLLEAIQASDEEASTEALRKLSVWVERVRSQLKRMRIDLQVLSPWLLLAELPHIPAEGQPGPRRSTLPGRSWTRCYLCILCWARSPNFCDRANRVIEQIIGLLEDSEPATTEWLDALAYDLNSAQKNAASLLDNYAGLASRAEAYFQAMSFRFLFDPQRHVFHIGYNVESGQLDSNYYDLMASEANIASLIAIARGDVPKNHWLYLARPLTEVNGKRALLSWSGTMFEYLMPTLFMESYPKTLLHQSDQVAVEQQIQYTAEKNIPWGISEAAYYNFDPMQIYQYQAFGVPSLGYKRNLSEDLVVAPYASILALSFRPSSSHAKPCPA